MERDAITQIYSDKLITSVTGLKQGDKNYKIASDFLEANFENHTF